MVRMRAGRTGAASTWLHGIAFSTAGLLLQRRLQRLPASLPLYPAYIFSSFRLTMPPSNARGFFGAAQRALRAYLFLTPPGMTPLLYNVSASVRRAATTGHGGVHPPLVPSIAFLLAYHGAGRICLHAGTGRCGCLHMGMPLLYQPCLARLYCGR
jgi:hypothetical protein